MKNNVELYHGGDLGDTVYAIPALRRLAYPAHLRLYPNHGVTRQLMDENNANMVIPLLNAQQGITASWVPEHSPDGLRIDFAVRRFYRNNMNLCDIHNHYIGHDHWHSDEPWFTVDKPDYRYPIVVARSARYRNDRFPWRDFYKRFDGRACFVGVPWEHEDFERHFGKIPYVPTPSLLEVARLMAGADLVLANQSCPRAVAEGLKTPILVEQGHPANTHFSREFAWYMSGDQSPIPIHWTSSVLEDIWCKNTANKGKNRTSLHAHALADIAKLTRMVRNVEGSVFEVGDDEGGIVAVLASALYRPVYIHVPNIVAVEKDEAEGRYTERSRYLRVHRVLGHSHPIPEGPLAYGHFSVIASTLPKEKMLRKAVEQLQPGGVLSFSGSAVEEAQKHGKILGAPVVFPSLSNNRGIVAYRPKG